MAEFCLFVLTVLAMVGAVAVADCIETHIKKWSRLS